MIWKVGGEGRRHRWLQRFWPERMRMARSVQGPGMKSWELLPKRKIGRTWVLADELSWAALTGSPVDVATAVIREVRESGFLSHSHTHTHTHTLTHSIEYIYIYIYTSIYRLSSPRDLDLNLARDSSHHPWWLRWSSIGLQCERPRLNPWVGKISWRRKWQATPVFLPGESHGQRSLTGYSSWGCKELDTTERLTLYLTVTKQNQ